MSRFSEKEFWERQNELFREIGVKPPESGKRLDLCTDSVMLAIEKVKELKMYGELPRSKIPEAQQYKTGAVMYGKESKEIKNPGENYDVGSIMEADRAINNLAKKVGFLTRNFEQWNNILKDVEGKAETRIKAAEEKVYIAEKKLETQASSLDALKDRVDSFELRY